MESNFNNLYSSIHYRKMSIIKECYHDFSCNEERYALEIWQTINRYNSELKGFYTSEYPKELLNDLHFEILPKSQMSGRRNLFCISLKYLRVNVSKLHFHLMTIGVAKEFIDKSSSEEKNYLTIWI
jgi:hypothetical protein